MITVVILVLKSATKRGLNVERMRFSSTFSKSGFKDNMCDHISSSREMLDGEKIGRKSEVTEIERGIYQNTTSPFEPQGYLTPHIVFSKLGCVHKNKINDFEGSFEPISK